MTLILTAICKDGMYICADKRYKVTDSDGSIRLEDTHNKISKFEQIPYVILNHGINKIDGKDWKVYCSEYEASDSWEGENHSQIVANFKRYIEKAVRKELNRYKDGKKHAIGFLLGGKPPTESKYKVTEIHWLRDKGTTEPPTTSPIHTSKKRPLLITGSDEIKAYLKKYIEDNLDKYSKFSKLKKTEDKLVGLFALAVEEKQKSNNEDFSDEYDVEFINE